MALITVKTYGELGIGLVLAPERYDRRREFLHNGGVPNGAPVAEMANTVSCGHTSDRSATSTTAF